MVDNPQWLALNKRRSELQQSRTRLLADRTPLHPEVQLLDEQMAEVEQRLAQLPQRVPAARPRQGEEPPPSPPAPSPSPQSPAAEPGQPHAEAVREFLARREAMTQAETARDRADQRERQGWQRQFGPSAVELQWADHAQPVISSGQRGGVLLSALGAGLLVAAAAGVLSMGAPGRDPAFSRVSQVEPALSIPVIGVISGSQVATNEDKRVSGLLARTLVRLGLLILLVGCIGMLLVMMNSQGPVVPN